ncbi:hypothetical protein [Actinoplanes awajinensis]|uniref:Lipoprotein LprG n=1 Tax=Actinoplanes awajinensis subsp. mycoplanecinus TaxID=135947 RepID=A0A101JJ88_9ACTN|nr:hypothetical protein [Actinoplanes awajinensis]KUL27441.1 hypothetical protein ADL15_35780 [Actinoplanes awajinensis subsp. mycoplanecinus]
MKAVSRAALAALTVTAALLAGCSSNDDKAPAAAASAAPAGNGIADLEGAAILDKAKTALKAAKSFHVKGAISQDESVTNLDLKIAGTDVGGSIDFGGAKLELLSVGGNRYMRPNAAFWTMMDSSGQMAKTLGSAVGTKWIKPSSQDTSLGAFFGAADVDELLKPSGTLTKGEAKTIDGVPAIGLVDGDDKDTVLYVATTGEPYPLKMERPAPEGLTFSEFGQTFAEIKEPAATDVIEMPKQ